MEDALNGTKKACAFASFAYRRGLIVAETSRNLARLLGTFDCEYPERACDTTYSERKVSIGRIPGMGRQVS